MHHFHNLLIVVSILSGSLLIMLCILKWLEDNTRRKYCHFFVRGLTGDQLKKLKANDIIFEKTTLPDGEPGVLFAPRQRRHVCKLLKARIVSHNSCGKDREELVLHFLPDAPAAGELQTKIVGAAKLGDKRLARIIGEILSPCVRKNISIHFVNGSKDPIQDDNFHIFFFATKSGDAASVSQPNKIWHTPNPSVQKAYKPTGEGLPIIDETTNFVVAELINNCLYVLPDLPRRSKKERPRWYWRLPALIVSSECNDAELGLLVRAFQHIRAELDSEACLRQITDGLKSDGLETASTQSSNSTVTIDSATGRMKQVLVYLTREILLPIVDRDIKITHAFGKTRMPINDDSFHIFFESSPTGKPILDAPDEVFGHRLLKKEKIFPPSSLGLPIVDDHGSAIAELLHNNLYLHAKLVHFGTSGELALLAKILLAVRNQLGSFNSLTVNKLEELVNSHFQDECLRQFNAGKVNKPGASIKSPLEEAQKNFSSQLLSAKLAQNSMFHCECFPNDELGREFDSLLAIPKVVDIKVTDKQMVVRTKILNCFDPKNHVLRMIGAFDIYLPFYSGENIRWLNRTQLVSNGQQRMNAPHVNGEGNACLGNMKDVLPALIHDRQFAAAIEVAIAFVESVNPIDTWGKHIGAWPVATPENSNQVTPAFTSDSEGLARPRRNIRRGRVLI